MRKCHICENILDVDVCRQCYDDKLCEITKLKAENKQLKEIIEKQNVEIEYLTKEAGDE